MIPSPFERFLDAEGFVVLDGGLATALEADGRALDTSLWSGQAVVDAPEAVAAVHRAYLEAGADCVTSAGYQLSFEGFQALGRDARTAADAMRRAVSLAVEARDAFWADAGRRDGRREPIVAASAGPYGAFLADGSEYDGRYDVEVDALDRFHRARLDVLVETEADVLAFETVPSMPEAEVLAALLEDRAEKPAWISFSCRNGERLWDGTPVEDAVEACAGIEALCAVGINCTHPGHVGALIGRVAAVTDLPVVVYPNSGETYDAARGVWVGPAEPWIDQVGAWVGAGARIVGGCCRVGPHEIRRLRDRLERMGMP